MNAKDALEILEQNRDELKRLGVRRIGVFGSTVRGEAKARSDLDLLVDLAYKTFDCYMDVKLFLEDLFVKKIDLVMTTAMKPGMKNAVFKEVLYAKNF